jgi:hypothetical protein
MTGGGGRPSHRLRPRTHRARNRSSLHSGVLTELPFSGHPGQSVGQDHERGGIRAVSMGTNGSKDANKLHLLVYSRRRTISGAGCSEERANTSTGGAILPQRRANASLHVKFELYMSASHFDGMAHNLQWLG